MLLELYLTIYALNIQYQYQEPVNSYTLCIWQSISLIYIAIGYILIRIDYIAI